MISLGVLLNYTTSYPQPGAQVDTDRRMDGQTGPGRAGRAGEAPAAMVSPDTDPQRLPAAVRRRPRKVGSYGGCQDPGIRGPPAPSQGTQESVSAPSSPKDPNESLAPTAP